jgi:hypothetical protein
VVDNASPDFVTAGEWQQSDLGYGGDALFQATRSVPTDPAPWHVRPLAETPAIAVWQPDLPAAGSYQVLAYIPYILNGLDDSNELRYVVQHAEGQSEVVIDGEEQANAWADLGTYHFDPAADGGIAPRVMTSTLAGDNQRGIWADAIAWVPMR